ncbi:MAG: glycosyltransferase [Syntrophomonadaceae bacterium]|nr:glycosyltransferase [Syntrophomonadaceae bacterium]
MVSRRNKIKRKRVLFVGHCYYNCWYLSRELRKLGWKADVVNIDSTPESQVYYHGEDYKLIVRKKGIIEAIRHLFFYLWAIRNYDIFHFSNMGGLRFSSYISYTYKIGLLPDHWEIKLLKRLNKKILYSNNGCQDGVSQTSFSKWGPYSVCEICRWRSEPSVCSDEGNLKWGKIRNELADYQITLGGNRADYNDDPGVHEVPGFYCLDHHFWNPDLLVPANYKLPYSAETVKIYHSVGKFESRSDVLDNQNIKCTHIYIPLIERLKSEGYNVELVFFHDVPNKKLRYYQVQADIVVDMLTFGFFGANIREAMMLGKPCICYLRPEWLASMRIQIPGFVEDLPVISATPDTIYDVLLDLVTDSSKRKEIGQRSREFAVKWFSAQAGAIEMSRIYTELLDGLTE